MDAGKEIICGHFYNLPNLSRWRWKFIRCHLFKPEGPLGGKEKEVGHQGIGLLLLRISELEGASNAWLHWCLGILHIFLAKCGPFHCWSALLIGNFCLQLTWSHWFYSSLWVTENMPNCSPIKHFWNSKIELPLSVLLASLSILSSIYHQPHVAGPWGYMWRYFVNWSSMCIWGITFIMVFKLFNSLLG